MTRTETDAQFNARIDAEDLEATSIPCPVPTCGAQVGESCQTDAGQERCRHSRRLWQVRKEREGQNAKNDNRMVPHL